MNESMQNQNIACAAVRGCIDSTAHMLMLMLGSPAKDGCIESGATDRETHAVK